MGFVGGGGNISIATDLPPSSFVYCIVNNKQFMEFLYLIFYACMRLLLFDAETNPGPRRPSLLPAEYSLMCGARQGTLVTWPWLHLSTIYYCTLRFRSQIYVMCRSCWFPDLIALPCCAVQDKVCWLMRGRCNLSAKKTICHDDIT